MVPNTLILRNFMCYRAPEVPQELHLDGISIACLSGDNGAGKSALLDAITWALWGKARMSDDELVAMGASEMEVELRFGLNQQEYRVQRKYQRGSGKRPGKSALDLQVRNGQGWKTLSELQKTQTQERIVDLLRMRYETFINSAFLLQGRADEFTRKAPGERKQVLADILDLAEYARLEERAKERVKDLAGKLLVLEATIVSLRAEADKQPFYMQERDAAQARVEDLELGRSAAEKALRNAEGRVRELEERRRQRTERATQLQQLQQQHSDQQIRVAELLVAITAAEATLNRAAEIAAGVAELRAARKELERLDTLRGEYDRLMEQCRDLREQLREAKRVLEGELRAAQTEQKRLLEHDARRAELHKNVSAAVERLAMLAPLSDERQQLLATRVALDERISRQNALLLRRNELESQIGKRQDSLVATREEQQRILKRLAKQLADLPRWQRDLAGAQQQQQLLASAELRHAALRTSEQQQGDAVIDLRSHCQSIKAQADGLKQRQALLSPDAAACPVCGSELGHEGVAQVQAHYEVELRQLRADYTNCRKQADAGDAQLKALRDDLTMLERELVERRASVATITGLEQQLNQAAVWQQEREAAQADLDSVNQQLEAREFEPAAQHELAQLQADLAALGVDPQALQHERRALDTRQQQLDKQLREQDMLQGKLDEQQQSLVALEAVLAELPDIALRVQALEATLEGGDYAHAIRAAGRAAEAELRALGFTPEGYNQARVQQQQLEHWDEQALGLTTAHQQLAADRRLHQELAANARATSETIAARQQELATLDAAIVALRSAENERLLAERQLETAKRTLDVAQRDLGDKESLLNRAVEDAALLFERQNERRELQEQQGIFSELRDAYGKKGIQAMLIETAIPEIEREANSLLGAMTDNQMHVAIKTQEATKSGTIQETLEIEVGDALGTRVYDAFSGGEAFRVNFAIRIALSKLLARRAGARLETLVIDEGFGALDAQGRERMVEAITSIKEDFKRILVITHIQELKDLFPAQIEIVKTAQGSVWQVL